MYTDIPADKHTDRKETNKPEKHKCVKAGCGPITMVFTEVSELVFVFN